MDGGKMIDKQKFIDKLQKEELKNLHSMLGISKARIRNMEKVMWSMYNRGWKYRTIFKHMLYRARNDNEILATFYLMGGLNGIMLAFEEMNTNIKKIVFTENGIYILYDQEEDD